MEKRFRDSASRFRTVAIFSRPSRTCSALRGEGSLPLGDSSDFSTSSIRSNALSNTLATVARRRAWSSSRAIALFPCPCHSERSEESRSASARIDEEKTRARFLASLGMTGHFHGGEVSRQLCNLQLSCLAFQALQPRAGCLDCWSSLGLRRARPPQGLFSDSSDFVQELADFHLQAAAAFLNSVEDVALHPSAVGFQQVGKKLPRIGFDHAMGAREAENQIAHP